MDRSTLVSCDALSTLRAATAEAHRQLEQAVHIEGCLAYPARYLLLLQAFIRFYRPLEHRLGLLTNWPKHGLDWVGRRKSPWLESDLRALGLSQSAVETQINCPRLPPTENLSQGFGCLYVLEGATLGGRQISALLQRSRIPADARRFFTGYGAETGARWREFLAALEHHASGCPARERLELTAAAEQTFACLHRWIDERMPARE